MRKIIIILLASILLTSCGSYKIDEFMRSRNQIVNQSTNKHRVYFTWASISRISIFSEQEVKDFFKQHPNLILDENSFKYVDYDGKQVIESFEYTGDYKDIKLEEQKVDNQKKMMEAYLKDLEIQNNSLIKLVNSAGKGSDNLYRVYGHLYNNETLFQKLSPSGIESYFNKSDKYKLKEIKFDDKKAKVLWFVFFEKNTQGEKQACYDAIKYSVRGAPAPTIYFNDVEKAKEICKECCQEELESRYYWYVTNGYMKRDIYLKFFPNGKYSDIAKKELAEIKNGKDIKDGVIDPLGDIQKTVDVVGKVYDNSVVGQTIKEIGKNLPKSENVNNQSNSNYEILEQTNITEIKVLDENARESSSISISVGCNNYKHSLDKENDGFSITYFSENRVSDKGFTLNKDLSFFKNEIDTKTIYENSGIAIISFIASNGKSSYLKIKFKKGGSYRLEIFGKK